MERYRFDETRKEPRGLALLRRYVGQKASVNAEERLP